MERVFGTQPPRREGGSPVPDGQSGATGGVPRWLLVAPLIVIVLVVIGMAVKLGSSVVPAPTATVAPVTRTPPFAPEPAATLAAPARPGFSATPVPAPDDFAETVSEPVPPPAPPRSRRAAAPAAAERASPTRGRVQAEDCPPGSDDNACIYGDVLRADRALRSAYDEAARVGVPTRALRDVRRRWDRARAVSLGDPDGTIRRFERLTGELDGLIDARTE